MTNAAWFARQKLFVWIVPAFELFRSPKQDDIPKAGDGGSLPQDCVTPRRKE